MNTDQIVKRPATWCPMNNPTVRSSQLKAQPPRQGSWIQIEHTIHDVVTNEVVVSPGEFIDWNTAIGFGLIHGREPVRPQPSAMERQLDAERRFVDGLTVQHVADRVVATYDFATAGRSGKLSVAIDLHAPDDEGSPPSGPAVKRALMMATSAAFAEWSRSQR